MFTRRFYPNLSVVLIAASLASNVQAAQLQPSDLTYLGAFLTPTTSTFADWGDFLQTYRGSQLSYKASGDSGSGSLLASFGDVVVELRLSNITPRMSSLQTATVIASTTSISAGTLSGTLQNDSTGGAKLVTARGSQTQDRIYWGSYEYYNTDITDYNSLGMSSTNLASPSARGIWHPGPNTSDASSWSIGPKHGEYVFSVPQAWADTNLGGRSIIVGRSRESAGAGGAAGPVMTAVAPINDVTPPAGGSVLAATPLMSFDNNVAVYQVGTGWQKWRLMGDPDWTYYSVMDRVKDGEWVESGSKRALVLVMRHGTFDNDPTPCTNAAGGSGYNGGFCIDALGRTPPWCYGEAYTTCSQAGPASSSYGFHAGPYRGRLAFIEPDDLADVYAGTLTYDQVDAYATYNLHSNWGTPSGTTLDRNGGNDPCGIAYDAASRRLYVCQSNGNDPAGHPNPAYPVIHVYEVATDSGDTTPPSVTISTSDPSAISTDNLTITGSASDAVGVSGCKWRIGAAPTSSIGTACTGTTSFSCATSGYSQGANTAYVGCYDAAGNYGSDSITVNLDSAAPSVSSATIASNGTSLTLGLNEAVTADQQLWVSATKAFSPGHYLAPSWAGDPLDTASNVFWQYFDSTDDAFVGVWAAIDWRAIETAENVYDFSEIDNWLTILKSFKPTGKLIVKINTRAFSYVDVDADGIKDDPPPILPDYIINNPTSYVNGGSWTCSSNPTVDMNTDINLFDADVTDRLIALVTAMAQYYANESALVEIQTAETATEDCFFIAPEQASAAGLTEAQLRVAQFNSLLRITHDTNWNLRNLPVVVGNAFNFLNWVTDELPDAYTTMCDAIYASRAAGGGPNAKYLKFYPSAEYCYQGASNGAAANNFLLGQRGDAQDNCGWGNAEQVWRKKVGYVPVSPETNTFNAQYPTWRRVTSSDSNYTCTDQATLGHFHIDEIVAAIRSLPSGWPAVETIRPLNLEPAGTDLTMTGCSGGTTTLSGPTGSGTPSLGYTISRPVLAGETGCVVSYAQPGNGTEDLAGNDLASFSSQAVTNGSVLGLVVLSAPSPSAGAQLAKTTTQTTIGIGTDKAADCRWGYRPGIAWGSLVAFETTGSTAHSSTLPVVAGGVYQICSRCLDAELGQYTADVCNSFSVAPEPKQDVMH